MIFIHFNQKPASIEAGLTHFRTCKLIFSNMILQSGNLHYSLYAPK